MHVGAADADRRPSIYRIPLLPPEEAPESQQTAGSGIIAAGMGPEEGLGAAGRLRSGAMAGGRAGSLAGVAGRVESGASGSIMSLISILKKRSGFSSGELSANEATASSDRGSSIALAPAWSSSLFGSSQLRKPAASSTASSMPQPASGPGGVADAAATGSGSQGGGGGGIIGSLRVRINLVQVGVGYSECAFHLRVWIDTSDHQGYSIVHCCHSLSQCFDMAGKGPRAG